MMSLNINNFKIYSDFNIEPGEFINLFVSVGWGIKENYCEKDVIKAINNTTSLIYARNEQGELIGLTRVFSDLVFTAYIADIAVRPDYQNNGIGKAMMDRVKTMYSSNIGIFFETLPDYSSFAESCGFTKRNNMNVFSKRF